MPEIVRRHTIKNVYKEGMDFTKHPHVACPGRICVQDTNYGHSTISRANSMCMLHPVVLRSVCV